MTEEAELPTVLVVDDQKETADAYALRLRGEYDSLTAYGGKEALEMIDDDIDVVLLDRRMPNLSGDDVLREIRDQDLDCRVIMITAIDPGFDIIDMPFDDYLCKPIDREDLLSAIDQQLRIVAYQRLSDYFELVSKQAVLEAEKTSHELEEHGDYVDLESRASELRAELVGLLDEFEEITEAFEAIDRENR